MWIIYDGVPTEINDEYGWYGGQGTCSPEEAYRRDQEAEASRRRQDPEFVKAEREKMKHWKDKYTDQELADMGIERDK